jgi:importin subunit beta-1
MGSLRCGLCLVRMGHVRLQLFVLTACVGHLLAQEELQLEEESPAENNKFVEQALPHLCPMLLETLLKQEEGTEGDDTVWNLNTAGGTCLGLVANTVGNALVPLILPFMQENATHADWRRREASLFAFGSMLDGPEESKLEPFVAQALPHLVAQLKDPMPHIQDTAAWTIGQAIKYVPGGVVPKEQPQMLSTVRAIIPSS